MMSGGGGGGGGKRRGEMPVGGKEPDAPSGLGRRTSEYQHNNKTGTLDDRVTIIIPGESVSYLQASSYSVTVPWMGQQDRY